MHARRTLAAAVLAVTATAALTACGSDPAPAPAAPAHLTATQAADHLADATGVTTLGAPQDNTTACATGSAYDCTALITTDTVSVYEFRTAAVAQHWAAAMPKTADWRQAGRFGLAFNARDQATTDRARRDQLAAALRTLDTADVAP